MQLDEKRPTAKTKKPKTKLGLSDLDHSKAAVLESLRSPESKRGYCHAIDEFIQWYCSEPRLSFNKFVVTRFRIALENRALAAGTINGRLAAVRRLAYEVADAGLLSPELAAGIRRVRGVKKLGVRLANWLTAEEALSCGRLLMPTPSKASGTARFWPSCLVADCEDGNWLIWTLHICSSGRNTAIVDMVGKGGHIRTVPVPAWVKTTVDEWVGAAELKNGKLFRCVCRAGKCWGQGVTERLVLTYQAGLRARRSLGGPRWRECRLTGAESTTACIRNE